ncbi:MAG: hypothetical protein Q8Q39_03335 [bacterium]|nr:hypothetical protein [bacterium]
MKIKLSAIRFPKIIEVTDQKIDISAMTDLQKEFYTDLFREVVSVYESKNRPRVIVGLVGPTGSGKSVIAALFKELSKQIPLPFNFETIGIDAFHFANDYLRAQKSESGTLKDNKGRFDTYDVVKLSKALESFSAGQKVSFPVYSRKTHDPVENGITINQDRVLLFVEGLWLLYDRHGWERIGSYLDFSIFIEADADAVREKVIKRHAKGGRSFEDALRYYDAVDAKNFNFVMQTKSSANKIISAYYKIQ